MYPKAVLKSKLYKDDTYKDDEDNLLPTGKISVKFAHTAGGTKKDGSIWTFTPTLIDANMEPIPKGVVIFGGSQIKVSFGITYTTMPGGGKGEEKEPDKFYAKASLQGVQVIQLGSSVRDGASLGFTKVEGYSATDAFGEPDKAEEGAEASTDAATPDF